MKDVSANDLVREARGWIAWLRGWSAGVSQPRTQSVSLSDLLEALAATVVPEGESAGEWYEIEEMWPPGDRWERAFALRYTKQQAQEVVERRRKLGIKARIIHCRAAVVATLPEPEGVRFRAQDRP